jgi:hypothetical protein
MEHLSQQIKALEETLLRRHTPSDREMLQNLLHDDFEEVGASGNIVTKADAIEWLLREDDNAQWSLSGFRIRQLSNELVLATYCAEKTNSANGVVKRSARSSLWKKTASGWAMLFHQGTNFAE